MRRSSSPPYVDTESKGRNKTRWDVGGETLFVSDSCLHRLNIKGAKFQTA